jgi:signal transduction histidine kinase/ligand-binding sensor domain-containing protein
VKSVDSKRRAVIALGILQAWCRCASALNPSLDVNQYAHTAWTVREGFFKGAIEAIAQTPDGYLWLGTEFGLLRFDGVRYASWQPPAGESLPSSSILSLLAARDGRLWIGTAKGLVSWKDGKLTHYPELTAQNVFALPLLEDRDGTIWAGGYGIPNGRLCAIQGGAPLCYGKDGAFGSIVGYLYEDRGGNLWVGAATGLWRWKPGSPKLYPMPGPPPGISGLIETDKGALLIAMRGGIRRFVDGKSEAYPLSAGEQPSQLLRDRDGGMWIGTFDRGLVHMHQGRTDRFAQSDGLSGNFVYGSFEDREGNVWVATNDGLDRFRDVSVPTISVNQGLSNADVRSVLAASDGSIWLGTRDGLNQWNDGQVTIYRKGSSGLPDDLVGSLFQDNRGRIWVSTYRGVAYFENGRFITVSAVPSGFTHAIAGDSAGNLWISHSADGLFHLLGGSVVERFPWAKLGTDDHALALSFDSAQGGLWLGFRGGGVKFFKDGQVRASYASADGLGAGAVFGLQLDRDGALWAATEGGLSRVKNGRVVTLAGKNGLPCDTVHWVVEDDAHSFWLYTACGLVRIARPEFDAWATDPKRTIQVTVFDAADGVRSSSDTSGASPGVAKSSDGRLWFVPGDGVSVIDPSHIPINSLPPPVHIEQMFADGKKYDIGRGLRLPPLVRNLVFDFVALSLVAPEKNRYRFKVEGWDSDWREAVNELRLEYSNLPPRQYRLRVIACNNSGVWNETGDTLEFSIAPAYYQTTWFHAACAAAFLAMLWGLYQLRLYQVRREFNAQLDGRVDERLRVARELHDTLLQSFQASLIQMQAARNVLARRPEKAEQSLDKAIAAAAGAVAEGRSAIQDLRVQPTGGGDLAQLLTAAGQELAHSEEAQGNPPDFRLTVEGEQRDLEPLLQDEVYRIVRELLRNAVRHAQAGRIEAEIRYESRQLRVHVRDDGKGIDPEVLKAGGRAGHFGLPGMRERADRFGGKLEFWSEVGAGTEAVLTVPAAAAYGASNGARFSFLRRKKARS